MKGKKYYIISNEDESLIKCENLTKKIDFRKFNNLNALEYGGNISSFIAYESELLKQLKELKFSSWPWNRSILIFLIPSNCTEVVKRAYFDSADHCDSKTTYLLEEYHALLYSNTIYPYKNKNFLILNFENSKFDITYFNPSNNVKIKAFNIESSLLKSISNAENCPDVLSSFIMLQMQTICSELTSKNVFILGYNRELCESFYDFLMKNKVVNPVLLQNKNQILIEGMENVVKSNSGVLIRRASL